MGREHGPRFRLGASQRVPHGKTEPVATSVEMAIAISYPTSAARSSQETDWPVARDASGWIEILYREHGRRVVAICGALLRNRDEAEDAAQQVFLSAYRALLNGGAPREPAAWLAAIARNECWSRMRATTPLPAEEVAGSSVDPPDDVIQRDELAAVWKAIGELPAGQREALLLREIRGFSYEQLADSLELSHPSIRSLLSRARQRVHSQVRRKSAALGGISWLGWLARLLAGSGDAGISVAAKATVVGLGAAALLGGAAAQKPAAHPLHAAKQTTHAPASRELSAAVLPDPGFSDIDRRVTRPSISAAHSSGTSGKAGGSAGVSVSDPRADPGGERPDATIDGSPRATPAEPGSDNGESGDAPSSGSGSSSSGESGSGSGSGTDSGSSSGSDSGSGSSNSGPGGGNPGPGGGGEEQSGTEMEVEGGSSGPGPTGGTTGGGDQLPSGDEGSGSTSGSSGTSGSGGGVDPNDGSSGSGSTSTSGSGGSGSSGGSSGPGGGGSGSSGGSGGSGSG
jgi:RNA polymerase sigma factor (sigma-70 family)